MAIQTFDNGESAVNTPASPFGPHHARVVASVCQLSVLDKQRMVCQYHLSTHDRHEPFDAAHCCILYLTGLSRHLDRANVRRSGLSVRVL